MNVAKVQKLHRDLTKAIDKGNYDVNTVLVVLGTLHNIVACEVTTDPNALKELYDMMGKAAVIMAKAHNDSNQFQAQEDAAQEEEGEKKGEEAGNVPGAFGAN